MSALVTPVEAVRAGINSVNRLTVLGKDEQETT
jgi:hypothetical protein